MTTSSPTEALALIDIKPGVRFGVGVLQDLLPDVETALFFGKVYDLDYEQLSNLLSTVLHSDLAKALFDGDHSESLQGYLVDDLVYPPSANVEAGDITFAPVIPAGELLPELWAMLELEVADSIKAVAEKLESVVGMLPGKEGSMLLKDMMKMNLRRPTLGVQKAVIHHDLVKENLLILDVSGSMSAPTVEAIIEDVVALSYNANAHLCIVSNDAIHWEPGSYDVAAVLARAQYGGTYYETLRPLLDRDWGVVITVADYDSSEDAKAAIARCTGHIDEVLDISLVQRCTFLAECVGQLADSVKPLLVATRNLTCGY